MTKSQVRRAKAWWLDREGEDEDFSPKLKDVLADQPLSEMATFSPKEDGYAKY